MSDCKKCGSTKICGPTYRGSGYGGGRLEYACLTCGYKWTTPTKDAAPSPLWNNSGQSEWTMPAPGRHA